MQHLTAKEVWRHAPHIVFMSRLIVKHFGGTISSKSQFLNTQFYFSWELRGEMGAELLTTLHVNYTIFLVMLLNMKFVRGTPWC